MNIEEFHSKYGDPSKMEYSILPSKRSLLQVATLSLLAFMKLPPGGGHHDDIYSAATHVAFEKKLDVEDVLRDFEEYIVNTNHNLS